MANAQRPPPFPSANTPRTWFITSAASPIGLTLSRALLAHGDKLLLGVLPAELDPQSESPIAVDLAQFVEEANEQGWAEKFKIVGLDARVIGQCQAAVAEAVGRYGGLDILFCCASEGLKLEMLEKASSLRAIAVIGTVEELAASRRSQMLVRDQMETNFFGPTNIIKAALPAMREKRTGHIMVLTGITSHLGTPGLGIYCAAGWALEGFCDSLAYEVAPFNIKLTIIQPHLEISVLSNKISAAPQLPQYLSPPHPAPLQRAILGRVLDRLGVTASSNPPGRPQPPQQKNSEGSEVPSSSGSGTSGQPNPNSTSSPAPAPASSASAEYEPLPSLTTSDSVSIQPSLSPKFLKPLLAETVYAICAIGGHENPPARHIVGNEAVGSVKEKLKTVSEELEDFVECSSGVDIEEKGGIGRTDKDTKREREDREREVGASTSQNSLVSVASGSGTEEIGQRGSKAITAGRNRSEESIGGGTIVAGKRGNVEHSSALEEMDVDDARDEASPERKRKGKGRKRGSAKQ